MEKQLLNIINALRYSSFRKFKGKKIIISREPGTQSILISKIIKGVNYDKYEPLTKEYIESVAEYYDEINEENLLATLPETIDDIENIIHDKLFTYLFESMGHNETSYKLCRDGSIPKRGEFADYMIYSADENHILIYKL